MVFPFLALNVVTRVIVMKRLLFTTVCLLQGIILLAQTSIQDTVFCLKEVDIDASRLSQFAHSNRILTLDSSQMSFFMDDNMATMLSKNSQIVINSYGSGGLSTTSIRGSGAAHTAVLWNGFNIQSPTDGGVNMALIPIGFVDEISLQYGGGSALFGSGAIGGILHFNNKAEYNKGIQTRIAANYGSFNQQQGSVQISYSNRNLRISTRAFRSLCDNDFSYINTAQFGNPETIQSNGKTEQTGVFQEFFIKPNAKNEISAHLWLQDNLRQIPPSMTMISNSAWQRDRFGRALLQWSHKESKFSLHGKSAYFNYLIHYEDPVTNIQSEINAISIINEAEARFHISENHFVEIGLNNTLEKGITGNYSSTQNRNRLAVFAAYRVMNRHETLNATLSLREEIIDNHAVHPVVSLGIIQQAGKQFILKANISKNYRVPTFNDLHWEVWGNPDLKPESGWTQEAGLTFAHKWNQTETELEATCYNSIIKDWIIWLPSGAIWHPENVQRVWARGIESSAKLSLNISDLNISVRGMYSFTRSTAMESEATTSGTEGKQLIYVPQNTGSAILRINYKGFHADYRQAFVGLRFTTADNTRYIEPYTIGDLSLGKAVRLSSTLLDLRFSIQNVFSETYQVMAWYAMPGRNYRVSLVFNFNSKKNEK